MGFDSSLAQRGAVVFVALHLANELRAAGVARSTVYRAIGREAARQRAEPSVIATTR